MQPQLNEQKLTEDQRSKLELYYQSQNQLKALKEIADMTQEMVGLLSDKGETESLDNMGVLLTDIRESLAAMKDKEAPETPDYAKPVVDAVSKLEKALSASIKAIDVKPNVTVDAPQVNVEGARVDLRGIEKIMGTLPDAFKQAVEAFPTLEKPDYAPLLKAWEGISEQLVSIENATRLKPLPGSMKVTNPDGSYIATLPASLKAGQQTVTTTATALPSNTLTQGVIFESLSTNTVSIFVGPAGVTTGTGVELQVGAALSAAVNNTNKLFVICASSAPVITWLGS